MKIMSFFKSRHPATLLQNDDNSRSFVHVPADGTENFYLMLFLFKCIYTFAYYFTYLTTE